jgi:hypothetical protein
MVSISSGFLTGPIFIVSVLTVETEREEADSFGAEPMESMIEESFFSQERNIPLKRTNKKKKLVD